MVIRAMVDKGPTGKKLQMVMADISRTLGKMNALADSNLHRKAFGNLKQLFREENFTGVFIIDGSVVILESLATLKASGKVSEADIKTASLGYAEIAAMQA